MGFGTNIKFSPLVLFILLLLVLALSVFVGNSIQSWVNPEAHDFESFIGYNYSVSLMSSQTITDYSTTNPLLKVYDNLYFDNKNGNVVKLLSTAYGGNSAAYRGNSAAYRGNTQLKAISVCGRDGISCSGAVQLPVTAPIPNSTLNTMTSSYTFFMPSSNLYNGAVTISEGANNVVNTGSTSSFFSNNLMFYVAWKTDTFLHVIDTNTAGNIPYSALSAYIPENGTPVVRYYDANRANPGTLKNQYPVQLNDIGTNLITDPNNNKMVSLQNYDSNKSVYQMSPGVFFDVSNGSLIINQPAGGINVYARPSGTSAGSYVDPTPQSFTGGRIATDTSATVSSVSYFPYYLITPDSNYLVMYIASGQNTVLYVITMRNKQFALYNLKRFIGNNSAGANGVIDNDGTLISPTRSGTSGSGFSDSGVSNSGMNFGFSGSYSDTNPVSDYYRWLAFWNTVANGTNQTSLKSASNMVSKSSVVPSVCPNCPNCKNCNGGVCTGCGGQGGSGTNFGQGQVQGGYYGGGGREGEPGPGRILYDTGSGTKDLLEKTGSGTTGLVRDAGKAGLGVAAVGAGLGVAAVQGGVGLAKDTVGGGVGLAKETVGGAVGLAKETVGGTIDLVKGAGTGAVNLLGNKNPTQVGEPGDGSSESGELDAEGSKRSLGKQGIPGIDPYSYYGALPAKGANYMPITADFSAFSR